MQQRRLVFSSYSIHIRLLRLHLPSAIPHRRIRTRSSPFLHADPMPPIGSDAILVRFPAVTVVVHIRPELLPFEWSHLVRPIDGAVHPRSEKGGTMLRPQERSVGSSIRIDPFHGFERPTWFESRDKTRHE